METVPPGIPTKNTAKCKNLAGQRFGKLVVLSPTEKRMDNGSIVWRSWHWAENSKAGAGYLYGDDVSFATSGSPGTYTNALNVASVDNIGFTGNYFSVADNPVFYTDSSANGYSNAPFTTLSGDYDYVWIDGFGQLCPAQDVPGP